MKRKPLPEPLRLRKKWCLETAEEILGFLPARRLDDPDTADALATILDCRLPLSYDQALAEWEEMKDIDEKFPTPKNVGPSMLDQLRDALGLGREHSLGQVMQAATEAARRDRARR